MKDTIEQHYRDDQTHRHRAHVQQRPHAVRRAHAHRRAGRAVLAVNDGSTDDSVAILERWKSEQGNGPKRDFITYEVNRGKADALRTDLPRRSSGVHARRHRDTDGQLDPTQMKDLLAAAEKNPRALIVGDRDMNAPDYPEKSKKGRRVSNLAVWMHSGLKVPDSQCGFRVYPLRLMDSLHAHAQRYGYETEVITRAAWAGMDVVSVRVTCYYEVPGGPHQPPAPDERHAPRYSHELVGCCCGRAFRS